MDLSRRKGAPDPVILIQESQVHRIDALAWAEGLSILVPVYNEAPILAESLCRMLEAVERQTLEFEVVLCENGSSDGTCEIVDDMARRCRQIRVEHLPEANYGLALKHGLKACRHDAVVIFNIDFWSAEFARAALDVLATSDLVIGSKMMRGSRDERPVLRRFITRTFNALLRIAFGFQGTDTHGMKALRRSSFGDILDACVTDHWILDTELVLRGERAGRRITEIPVVVREVRAPSYGSLLKRVPTVLRNLVRLVGALRSSVIPQPPKEPDRNAGLRW